MLTVLINTPQLVTSIIAGITSGLLVAFIINIAKIFRWIGDKIGKLKDEMWHSGFISIKRIRHRCRHGKQISIRDYKYVLDHSEKFSRKDLEKITYQNRLSLPASGISINSNLTSKMVEALRKSHQDN
ncbi:hypothetical protein [Levilactobacillus parabrevis]|uniref:hypothetical protein n=1 Tax=Levilactobacillus parabrevis TaxID=357278 RepID=UPI0037577E93